MKIVVEISLRWSIKIPLDSVAQVFKFAVTQLVHTAEIAMLKLQKMVLLVAALLLDNGLDTQASHRDWR